MYRLVRITNMTDLNRKALLSELSAIIKRADSHIASKGPASSAVAVTRSEMAHTLKTDIQNGVYDVPGASARDLYLDNLRQRYTNMTPRQRKRLYDLDSTISISIRRLTLGTGEDPEAPTGPLPTEGLATPKPKRGPWFWPLWSLTGLVVIALGGTLAALFIPA